MSIIKEFKEFAVKGNAVDMAVGIVIGASFNKIVNSLVNDVIMPPIGWILGGTNFSDLVITLQTATDNRPAVVLKYGAFINNVLDFFIIAFSIFVLVKVMNRLKDKESKQ
ncbi:MAG: large-conductance mechanosensitive channel protein MscL [Candidatus Omnitrophota bacterium]|nr:large-conductance mechanosensitive channel protein MscL [Candidatus Omnitrophota bacterium]